jgi:hypothetical protein
MKKLYNPTSRCQSCNVRDVEVRLRFEETEEGNYSDVFWLCRDCASLSDGVNGGIKEALLQLSNWH